MFHISMHVLVSSQPREHQGLNNLAYDGFSNTTDTPLVFLYQTLIFSGKEIVKKVPKARNICFGLFFF